MNDAGPADVDEVTHADAALCESDISHAGDARHGLLVARMEALFAGKPQLVSAPAAGAAE